MTTHATYMGYRTDDFEHPFAKFFNDMIASIPANVAAALEHALPSSEALDFEEVTKMANKGYDSVENGYFMLPDGGLHVAVLTPMLHVTPPMWDWWFGWHGCQDNRYKLWHPAAHKSARWEDGREDEAYIGRTSIIEEYIGTSLEKAAIQFVHPTALGFSEEQIADKDEVVYICARLGYPHLPVDFGWLVHQVRKTAVGAEMRSRFWMGGKHIQLRGENKLVQLVSAVLPKIAHLPERQAKDLLQHCSEEMNHLAKILPDLYHEFHESNPLKPF